MRFPNASLVFTEGFESEMDLQFLPEETGTDTTLGFHHALMAIVPESERVPGQPLTPGLLMDDPPAASLDKVENGVRDLCAIALYHLRPVILGDFGWVVEYQKIAASQAE